MINITSVDSQDNRFAYLARLDNSVKVPNGVIVNMQISCTLPLFTLPTDLISRTKVYEEVTAADHLVDTVTNLPYDPEYEDVNLKERFIYVTRFVTGITKAANVIMYDRKYDDLLVLPDLSFLDNSDDIIVNDTAFIIKAFRIGSIKPGAINIPIDSVLPATNDLAILSEPKSNIGNTVTINLINGIANDTKNKNVSVIEKYTTGVENIRGDALPCSFINLGNVLDVFGSEVNVPFFLGHQTTPETYALAFVGNKSPKNRDLFIMLKF